MRGFLRKHSAVYQKAVRPLEGRIASLETRVEDDYRTIESLDKEIDNLKGHIAADRQGYKQDLIEKAEAYDRKAERIAAANERMRRINRDLVAKLRELGVTADEWPAEKCPSCGSLAAMPSDKGKHQTGTVKYDDRTARLYCDGTEE